ncbi:hypothetical protein CR513_17114, partial [Mucuna pruriens]
MLHMKEEETVNSYFARTLKISKSMKACESNNLDTMTIDELQSSLLVHEQRMTGQGEEEQMLQITNEDRRERGRGRGSFRGRGRGRQSFNKVEIKCFKRHKLGHFQYECPTWEKKLNYAKVEDKVEQEDELLLMAYVDFKQGKEDEWFLDLGCSNHMSGNKEWFSDYDGEGKCAIECQWSYTWHSRLGHLSYNGLRILSSEQIVNGLPSITILRDPCTYYLAGKQHRNSMSSKSLWRASTKLQLIHADIYGPIIPISSSNKRYILMLVEKEDGVSIKCLKTDRGGEFTLNEFGEFCKSQGIRRQLTAAYTPQQNGVVERKNRTIINMVCSMLIGKQVHSGLNLQDAHVHVPDQQRVKLDDKNKKCVLLKVSDESKAYCLFDSVNKKVLISKIVNEEEYQQDILDWGEGEESYEENVVDSADTRETREQNEKNVMDSSLGTSAPPNKSHTNNYETIIEGRVRRNIREPVWMIDYEKGEGLSDDDGLNVMMVTEDDISKFIRGSY